MTALLVRAGRIAVVTAIWLALIHFLTGAVGRMPSAAEWADFAARGALPGALVFALCFTLALTLRTWRFGTLIRHIAEVPWPRIAWAFPWLFMIGAITPFRLGDVARAAWVRRQGGSGATTVGLWLAERATDMLALVGLCLAGAALAPAAFADPVLLWSLLGIVGLGYVVVWTGRASVEAGLNRLAWPGPALARVAGGFRYMQDPRLHAGMVAMSVAIWTAMVLAFWGGLTLALGADLPLAAALLCVGSVNLAALVSAAPGNIGSFQAAVVGSLALYDVPADEALMAGTVLQGAGLLITLGLGCAARLALAIRRT